MSSTNKRKQLNVAITDINKYRGTELHALVIEAMQILSDIYREEWTELTKERFDERKGAAKQVDALIDSLSRENAGPPIF